MEDVYIAGRKINELNNLKLNATNITAYATALKGLNAKQAELVLSTQGLTLAQKQAILSQAELLGSTGKLTFEVKNFTYVVRSGKKYQIAVTRVSTTGQNFLYRYLTKHIDEYSEFDKDFKNKISEVKNYGITDK